VWASIVRILSQPGGGSQVRNLASARGCDFCIECFTFVFYASPAVLTIIVEISKLGKRTLDKHSNI
jgi:hypothetical protein